jgi:hypothetical protein
MAKQAVINGAIMAQIQGFIQATDPDYFKNARVLGKVMNLDRKFNKWLASDGKMGIKFFDDAEFRSKLITDCEQYTSVQTKQAIVIAMLKANIDDIVKSKHEEVTKGIVLSEEQKLQHAEVLNKFAITVKRNANQALVELGLSLGVVEFDEVPVTEPAEMTVLGA